MPPPPPMFSSHGEINDNFKYQYPPCIKCGNNQNTAAQNFKKIYNSPVAVLGIFFGILPYLILSMFLKTTQHLTAPFCGECWNKYKNADTYSALISLAAFVGLVISIFAAVGFESWLIIAVGFIGTLIFYIYGTMYIKRISPKFKKVDSKQVIIDAPIVGEIFFTK